MNNNQSQGMSRRTFLNLAGAAGASTLVPKGIIGGLLAQNGSLRSTQTALDAFYSNRAFRPVTNWLSRLSEFERVWLENADIERLMIQAGISPTERASVLQSAARLLVDGPTKNRLEYQLLNQGEVLRNCAPGRPTIVECLRHPVFEETHSYAPTLAKRGVPEVADELCELVHAPDAVPKFVRGKIIQYKGGFDKVKNLALNNQPEIPEIKARPDQLSAYNFSDMAAARKAGGYAIPANYPEHERGKIKSGRYHTSSCEWHGRVRNDASKGIDV